MTASEARLRANAKWDAENTEKITVKLHRGKDPSREQIKAAADRWGLSVNAFIIKCIRENV